MTIDIENQLSELGSHLEAAVPDLTIDEVLSRPEREPSARPATRWVVVAGAVALVLAVLLPLLFLSDSGEPDVVATTVPTPVTTVVTPPDATTPPTTAGSGAAPAPEGTLFAGSPPLIWETIPEGTRVPFGNVVWSQSGYWVAEATVDRSAADRDLLWASEDGVSWTISDSPLPEGVTLPLLVRTDSGYWLTSNGDDVRVWHSTSLVDWVEVDTTSIQHLRPFVVPYTDGDLGPGTFDLSSWRETQAWVSNGSVVVGQWGNSGFFGWLAVSDELAPFAAVRAPWGPVPAYIVSSSGTFYAYVSRGLQLTPGEIWTSTDGLTWTQASAELPFKFDSRGEPAHDFEVVERNGVFLAQAGYFCPLGDLWISFDGVDFTPVGPTPDAGAACGGSLHAADFGFVLVTDGGTDPPQPSIWVSPDGIDWSQLDLEGLGIVGGNGETARSQLEFTVERDAVFIHNYMVTPGPMWVGRPVVVVEIGDGTCASSIDDDSEWEYRFRASGPLVTLEIRNETPTGSAIIIGAYADGFDRDDLVAYGRDISTRPPFIEDAEIFQVAAGGTATIQFDGDPGRYAVVCMDTTSTMVVLDDLVISSP